jgi:hypothetical protein
MTYAPVRSMSVLVAVRFDDREPLREPARPLELGLHDDVARLVDVAPFSAQLHRDDAALEVSIDLRVLRGDPQGAARVDEAVAIGARLDAREPFVEGLGELELGFDHDGASKVDVAPAPGLSLGQTHLGEPFRGHGPRIGEATACPPRT